MTIITNPGLLSKLSPLRCANAAIIVQNMVLAVAELGVDSSHIWGATAALANTPEILQELHLSEGFVPCCAITLGKTDELYEIREIPMDRIATTVVP